MQKKLGKLSNIYIVLTFFCAASYFFGFYFEENSAGAGTLNGDFKNTWKNINTFKNYGLGQALGFVNEGDRDYYISSRTPVLYIFIAYLNPFTKNIPEYLNSIFIFSLIGPVLFYILLRSKLKNINTEILILISSILFLSPYFRTSGFWGNEENFGTLSLIISLIFLEKFKNEIHLNSFSFNSLFLIFFSSLTLYFDQKLLIIPLLCFIEIILSDKKLKSKFYHVFFYFICSLPFIYFIYEWKNIIPTGDALERAIGKKIYISHLGFASTIIVFYLFPFFVIGEEFKNNFKIFIKTKISLFPLVMFLIYVIANNFLYDFQGDTILGKGIVHKFTAVLFQDEFLKKFFLGMSFFISLSSIYIYCMNNFQKKLIFGYFLFTPVIIYPFQQEYFDPIILILVFYFFSKNLILVKKNILFLISYFSIFLVSANIYYYLTLR